MACKVLSGYGIICGSSKKYNPGDMPPDNDGYFDRYEWAEVQTKAGLKQEQCPTCGRWRFPQEMSTITKQFEASDTIKGKHYMIDLPLCKKCANDL